MQKETKLINTKKKIEPYTKQWHKKAYSLAMSCVTIVPCRDCNEPVLRGYCCTWCESTEP